MYKTPKLALFDLDGTLIHHENDLFYEVYCRLFVKLGKTAPARSRFDQLLSQHSLFADIAENERNDFEETFWKTFENEFSFPSARPYDGALETLEHFVSSNTKVAIVTARTQLPDDVEILLEHTGLLKHIQVISTLGEPHLKTYQSSPELKKSQILDVCKKLQTAPSDSLIAGDSPSDITSGHAAGVAVMVALLSGGVSKEILEKTAPHLLLNEIHQMPSFFT